MSTPLTARSHYARSYQHYQTMLDRVEDRLRSARTPDFGYPSEIIRRRLLQIIVDKTLNPFLRESAARFNANEPEAWDAHRLQLGPIHIKPSNGKFRVSIFCSLKGLGYFLYHWSNVLFCLLATVRRTASMTPATLIYGVEMRETEMGRFLAFCENGPITPLRHSKQMIIQSKNGGIFLDGRLTLSHDPLRSLIQTRGIEPAAALKSVGRHLSILIQFLLHFPNHPWIGLLAYDLAFDSLARYGSENHLIQQIFLTNSLHGTQYLWMRLPDKPFTTHMAWYSSNSMPFLYKHDPVEWIFPTFHYLHVDESWVWNREQADFLSRAAGRGEFHVVGPILWYLPIPSLPRQRSAEFTIGVFDVTPITPKWEKSFGLLYNYYNLTRCTLFLDDILAACQDSGLSAARPIRVLLKHKRKSGPSHHPDYIEHVQRLANTCPFLNLLPPDTDLYSLISSCDLVVAIPYSSPAVIAAQMGVPALYYDPTDDLLAPSNAELPLLSGRKALEGRIQDLLSRVPAGEIS